MTDQMSNRNVEDVLSSIRRLVSQETLPPPADQAENAPARHVPLTPTADKLVLTPALRVNETAPAATQIAAPVAQQFDDEAPALSDATATSAQRLAAGLTVKRPPETSLARHSASLESTIAALEAAISSSAEHWETDASGELSSHAGGNVTALHRNTPPAAQRKPIAAQPQQQADHVAKLTAATPEPAPGSAEPLHLTIADRAKPEPRFNFAAAAPEPTPSAPQSELTFPIAPETDAAPNMAVAATLDAKFPDQPAPQDDALIDEDTLYDMVSEIVRAELQGQLGERITRNIRKLVRTEVARALAEKQYL